MNEHLRLTKSSQFATVYSRGSSWANELLAMKAIPNGMAHTRFGFSINKRVGKAVVRNRLKRRLRGCVQSTAWSRGWDIVFVARRPAGDADYWQLRSAMGRLNRRARLKDLS